MKKKWLVTILLILAFWLVFGLIIWQIKKPSSIVPQTSPAIGSTPTSSEENSAAPGPWEGSGGEGGVVDEGEEVIE